MDSAQRTPEHPPMILKTDPEPSVC
jgi:hypothetical protein